jgi:hypothetical protein
VGQLHDLLGRLAAIDHDAAAVDGLPFLGDS